MDCSGAWVQTNNLCLTGAMTLPPKRDLKFIPPAHKSSICMVLLSSDGSSGNSKECYCGWNLHAAQQARGRTQACICLLTGMSGVDLLSAGSSGSCDE